ncbi:hypothetical protein WR25_11275 [Diploscapter pachys]|uniref:Uncharacterized protein n=1 Tax=Diploscapter pachys TaxID=2018661 RepID=A0A2A2KAW3_9BILA|nr:hypothetical protein WR25_11275 [Diploscapter pachys]
MQSLRKLMNKPRPDDWAPLAKFYYADEALNDIASELDSFDGRRDPERCNGLVNKLRVAQDRILHIIHEMLVTLFPRESERACRDFRSKFPDEIVQDTLPGQLWFGAECLAAGSNIIDHESESDLIRPLAKELTRHLDHLRDLLKDQSLRDPSSYTEQIKDSLLKFDHLFANFEYHYVCAMVPVKSEKEHDALLDVAVLFSEVLDRALKKNHITQDQIDYCDPSVILVIPRLGIVWGLLYYPEGALNVDGAQENLPEMFRPFHSLLTKIRNLLRILSSQELGKVEKVLCMGEPEQVADENKAFTISDFRAKARKRKCREKTAVETIMEGDNLVDDLEEDSEADDDAKNVVIPEGAPPDPTNLRSRFRSSDDLIHRLFVCIAGVADQLQTNYSSDIRRVLKWILQPPEVIPVYEVS